MPAPHYSVLYRPNKKRLWFEITKMLKNKFVVSFVIIFGILSFHVVAADDGPCSRFHCLGHSKNVYDDDDDDGVIGSLMTQKEYIIPLAFDSKSFSLFNKNLPANQQSPIREGISSLEQSVSIRPRVLIDRSAALSKYEV